MKKKYTVFLLLLTLSVYAQKGKIKETSEKGVYFEQNGEMILVYRGSMDGRANSGYVFSYGKDGTIELKGKASVPTFKSPNEVVIVQDAAGNRYWKLIDGTIVKTELAGEVSTLPATNEVPIIKKEEENSAVVNEAPITKKEEENSAVVNEAPITKKEEENSTVVNEVPIIKKEEENSAVVEVPVEVEIEEEEKEKEIVIPEPKKEIALPEKEIEIEIEEANIVEEKPEEEEIQVPEVQSKNEQNLNEFSEFEKAESTVTPTPSTEEELEKTEVVETTAIPYIEEDEVDELKNIEANPTPQEEVKTDEEIDSIPSSDVNFEVSNPSDSDEEEKIILEAAADAPNEDKSIISTIGEDGIEEIQVIDEEVGDISNMFEKNYEDMSRKEKKLYKKNEKKLMKQLEKELNN